MAHLTWGLLLRIAGGRQCNGVPPMQPRSGRRSRLRGRNVQGHLVRMVGA
jgi:hypothetical protein